MKKNHKRKILLRIIIIFAILLVFVFILLYFSKGHKINNNLLQASKDYFSSQGVQLPVNVGECGTVTLDQLLSNDFVKNEELLSSCDKKSTYVQVCKLESENYHYTPVIKCNSSEDTKFGTWEFGNEEDLIEDESNVRFSYRAQIYSTKVKSYYPNDEYYVDDVDEYYASSPSSEYNYSEGKITASKWYTEETGNTYWNDGGYSSTEPNGYPSRGKEGTSITSISLTKPFEVSYRTISQVTLYRTKTITKPYILYYICVDSKYTGEIHSNVPCESRSANNYNWTLGWLYTCDGKETVNKNAKCSTVSSDWSTKACVSTESVECETTKGYKYVDRRWQWFTTGKYRKYYPSGSKNSSSENTYYISSPISGAIEDKSTTTEVQKYYRLVDDLTNNVGTWFNISEEYLNEEELIKLFKTNGYDVESLDDIMKTENIRYEIRLEYSNRK